MSCLQVATFNARPSQSQYRTRKRVTLSWGKERVVVPRIRGEKDRITTQEEEKVDECKRFRGT